MGQDGGIVDKQPDFNKQKQNQLAKISKYFKFLVITENHKYDILVNEITTSFIAR